jgi:hypothetical protein
MLERDRLGEAKAAFVEASADLDRARLASAKAEDPDAELAAACTELVARRAVADAKSHVDLAIRRVMLAEAELVVDTILRHEAEALALRAILGSSEGLVARLMPQSDRLERVLRRNDELGLGDSFIAADAVRRRWSAFYEALAGDTNASLDLRALDL